MDDIDFSPRRSESFDINPIKIDTVGYSVVEIVPAIPDLILFIQGGAGRILNQRPDRLHSKIEDADTDRPVLSLRVVVDAYNFIVR